MHIDAWVFGVWREPVRFNAVSDDNEVSGYFLFAWLFGTTSEPPGSCMHALLDEIPLLLCHFLSSHVPRFMFHASLMMSCISLSQSLQLLSLFFYVVEMGGVASMEPRVPFVRITLIAMHFFPS